MGTKRALNLRFPLGGLYRRSGFQAQPPFTTPETCNCRPDGNSAGRERGGSRPFLVKAWPTPLGGGNPIRLLATVRAHRPQTAREFADEFTANLAAPNWVSMRGKSGWTGLNSTRDFPYVLDGYAYATTTSGPMAAGYNRTAALDPTKAYSVVVQTSALHPYAGANEIRLFAALKSDWSHPSVAGTGQGVIATLLFLPYQGGIYLLNLRLQVYDQGMQVHDYTVSGGGSGDGASGDFSLSISPGQIRANYGSLANATVNHWTLAGTCVAFGLYPTAQIGGGNEVRALNFRHGYAEVIPNLPKPTTVVAAANGLVYYTDTNNAWQSVGGAVRVGTDTLIHGVDRLGTLFIADVGPHLLSGVDGAVSAAPNNDRITTAASLTGVSAGDHLWVYDHPSVTKGAYKILAVGASYLQIDTALTAGATGIAFRVLRGPKVLKTLPGLALEYWANQAGQVGKMPAGCPLVAVYRDRLVLGGAEVNPNVFYMARVGNPYDWNYGASDLDPARAVAGTASDGNTLGEPLTAIIAASNDYLLFGCENSLWILRGDAAYGGQMGNLSRIVGIVSRGAWCWGPEGQVIFLSRHGVYELPPGANAFPQPISRQVLPRELLDVDPLAYTVTMSYDARDEGVHIYLTPTQAGLTVQHWWMDWPQRSFWPTTLHPNHEPTALVASREAGLGASDVLLGCRDGYIRRFSDGATTDDGVTVTSWIDLGPVPLGGGYYEGVVTELFATLAQDSGPLSWQVRVADTPEESLSAAVFDSGDWTAGLNYKSRPRARGAAMTLRLTSQSAWEIEDIQAQVKSVGRLRRG